MTNKKHAKKPTESTRCLAQKYEGLHRRMLAPDGDLSEFEVKMYHAFKVELTKRGYFELSEAARKALL